VKKKYPHSTLVLDAGGKAAREWELGEQGSVLVIVDPQGLVQYMAREAMSGYSVLWVKVTLTSWIRSRGSGQQRANHGKVSLKQSARFCFDNTVPTGRIIGFISTPR
jgi:hypothetical protein